MQAIPARFRFRSMPARLRTTRSACRRFTDQDRSGRQSTPNGSRMSLRRAMSPATVPEAVVICFAITLFDLLLDGALRFPVT